MFMGLFFASQFLSWKTLGRLPWITKKKRRQWQRVAVPRSAPGGSASRQAGAKPCAGGDPKRGAILIFFEFKKINQKYT